MLQHSSVAVLGTYQGTYSIRSAYRMYTEYSSVLHASGYVYAAIQRYTYKKASLTLRIDCKQNVLLLLTRSECACIHADVFECSLVK